MMISGAVKTLKWWCSGADFSVICENDMLWSGNLGLKMGVSKMAHTQYAHIWKCPPGGGGGGGRWVVITQRRSGQWMLKHKDSFGKSENLSKLFFAEILVFDHDYEGKSSSSNGLLWISFINVFIFIFIIFLILRRASEQIYTH